MILSIIPLLIFSASAARLFKRNDLIMAAIYGQTETIKDLLDNGENVNVHKAYTPLHYAAMYGHIDSVNLLLSRNADIDAMSEHGCTPLFSATQAGHVHVVKSLLEHGANVNAVCPDGRTPLHVSASNHHAQTDLVTLLLENGADPNMYDEQDSTPLHSATELGHTEIVKLLLENGADPNAVNQYGNTPLHWAATGSKSEIVKLLIDNGANVNDAGENGRTALYYATYYPGHTETLRLLLDAGANVNVVDNEGDSPLDFAAIKERKDAVELLQEAIVHCPEDWSPVHYAAAKGNIRALDILIERGKSFTDLDAHGKTPLEYAYENVQMEAVELLQTKIKSDQETLFGMISKWWNYLISGSQSDEFTPDRLHNIGMHVLEEGDQEKLKRLGMHADKYYLQPSTTSSQVIVP